MKKTILSVAALLVLVVGLSAINAAAVVTYPDEYTVIKQFGKIVDIRDTEGLSFKIPFIQKEEKLPRQVMLYDLAVSDVMTQDKKSMIADCFVLWRITDPLRYTQTLSAQKSNAEYRLDTIVYNSLKNIISSLTQEQVISGRDGTLAQAIKSYIGNTFNEYGIELIAVETKSLDLPNENKNAVYERMISERNNIAATFKAEGEEQAQQILNDTNAEIIVMKSQAQAEAEKIIAAGEASYMQILSGFYNDEAKADFYLYLRSLDAAKIMLSGGNNTLIIDESSPIASIFYGN